MTTADIIDELRRFKVPEEYIEDAVSIVFERILHFNDNTQQAIEYVVRFVKKTKL